ncbi:hypothetical protein SB781_31785, partial [Paraburkholderia sp. SIMBA_061]
MRTRRPSPMLALLAVLVVMHTAAIAAASPALVVVAFGDSTTAPRVVDGKQLDVYADRLRRSGVWGDLEAVVVNA